MSFLHHLLRTTFIKYYEIRRRFRGWHRRITYRPGITFHMKTRIQILKWTFLCLIVWHLIGANLISHIKMDDENGSPLKWLKRKFDWQERIKQKDDVRFHYPTLHHWFLSVGKPKADVKVEMFKEEYPMDEW